MMKTTFALDIPHHDYNNTASLASTAPCNFPEARSRTRRANHCCP